MRRAILGIDQAVGAFSKNTHAHSMIGWAIFLDTGDWHIESWGEVDPDPPQYLNVATWLVDAIGTLKAQGYEVHVAIETVYAGPNRDVTLKLAHIQGYIHGIVISMQAEYSEVLPSESLRALTGISSRMNREDRKRAMVASAEKVLGETPSDHIADAVGIAQACLNRLTR